MKKKWMVLSAVLLMAFLPVHAQWITNKSVKVYGYSRITLPGTVPVDIDVNGNRVEKKLPEPQPSYRIFISGKPGITVTALFINGKRYNFQQEQVVMLPVKDETPGPIKEVEEKVLVPGTDKHVIQLTPVAEQKPSAGYAAAEKAAKKTGLFILYTCAGKKYMASLKKIIVLEPIAAY